ncbi:hypothetical protein BDA96_08G158300 [Sorghum bicolor]|uniref:Uncharacterized protein n=1 Tax=Sorghum bicolor TaxID=4558 RepID=A0A921QJA4_SORBI|nr:hypothetical protein BDA96_08G158300 [Sorghum bicolor]
MMMDRQQLVRQCDMEVMKMAMLKHEETFRQQVHELHRLYRIQRELMSGDLTRDAPELTMSMTTRRRRSKQPRRALNLQLPADEYIVSADEDEDADAAACTELELTLAIGGRRCSAGGSRRKSNGRRQQQAEQRDNAGSASPFGSDCSGASVLSSSPSPPSAEYYSDDGPAVFHALPPPPPCQRAVAFDLGLGGGMMMRQHAPWLQQCHQYLSLRMT